MSKLHEKFEPLACPHASTIVVVRDAPDGGGGVEVFMVQRHAGSHFLADRFVYPGGRLDAADCTDAAARRVEGRAPADILAAMGPQSLAEAQHIPGMAAPVPPAQIATGLFLAGIRETFEEAGILLARRAAQSHLIDLTSDPDVAARFRDYRRALNHGELALSELAAREDLCFPLDRIAYFAHWITPFTESTRYDTRFFLARAPAHQRPLHDARETSASTWIRPRDAVQANQAGHFQLAPPTLHTLMRLAEFESAHAAFDWARAHRPPTVLPHVTLHDSQALLLLPGDPQFPATDPSYLYTGAIPWGPTRMVAQAPGVWRVQDA